jgi:nucleotide-binding universal stress UspA family protein
VEREAVILEQEAQRDAAAARALFEKTSESRSAPVRWRDLAGDMKRQLCEQAACADLVVLGQYEAQGTPERHPLFLAEEVVLNCGRPVLVLPDNGTARPEMRRALIAWDASREATRALHDALPLLARSRAEVEVVAACEHGGSAPTADLIDHLARHGIALDTGRHLHTRQGPGDALLQRLARREFDLLVMGAYGRPVWMEYLFGGTTRSTFMRTTAPLLVSH